MIHINLLPPEYIEAQRKKEQKIIFGGLGGGLFLVLLLFWGVKKSTAANLAEKIQIAEKEKQSYQTIIDEIKQIEQDKKRMENKLRVIRDLNRSRLVYPVFFEDFIPIVPSDVWIKGMNLTESGGNNLNVDMQCSATSNFALATWLTNMEQSPHFSGVTLGAISYGSGDVSTLSFKLTTNYRHQGPFPLEEYFSGGKI